jgi:dTDP-4-amino-4,6-dideoxygalactose transaminase
MKRIPLRSWDGEDWDGHEHINNLERFIGKSYTCATNTVQTAIQCCLELLGTRTAMIPVIMPVTAPPDTLCAALRAGAHPLLLDIDAKTLQIDPQQLEEALKEIECPIVIFTRPGGMPVDERLLSLVDNIPTIVDSRLIPHNNLGLEDLSCTWNIFDLSPVVGSGGVIVHKFTKQVEQLKLVRSGIMGHSGSLSEIQAKIALDRLKNVSAYFNKCGEVFDKLSSYKMFDKSNQPLLFYSNVKDASKVITNIQSEGVEAVLGVFPLCGIPEVQKRYKEAPEYPVAFSLSNKILCLPTHTDMADAVLNNIGVYINEVTGG